MKRYEKKVLYIKDKKMLEEVRQLLIEKGQRIATDGTFKITQSATANYLQFYFGNWWLGFKCVEEEELTYEEFINLLNQ